MQRAFVLICCDPGKETSIIQNLKEINQVKKVQGTIGSYDVVAEIETNNDKSLKQIISDQIRHINNIQSTMTLIQVESESKLPEDIIPDIIPDEKKPLEPPSIPEVPEDDDEEEEEDEEEDDEDDDEGDEDYKIKGNP